MSKQTALDWFIETTSKLGYVSADIAKQAKKMEKEQIEDAQSYAISNADMTNNKGYFDCEKYYKETYGGQDEK